MAFQLGNIAEIREHGVLHGIQREIACECWLIKVMDEDGMLHTIRNIQLLTTEEKTYCGIQTVEHLCKILLRGRVGFVKLIYTKENCRWTIMEV